jgi:hypothetical protein
VRVIDQQSNESLPNSRGANSASSREDFVNIHTNDSLVKERLDTAPK